MLSKRPRLLLLLAVLAAVSTTLIYQRVRPVASPSTRWIELDLNTVELRPVILDRSATHGKTFTEIVKSYKPYAAINGTFYDDNLCPLGDVLVDGKLLKSGRYRNAVAVRNDGRTEFVQRRGERFDWNGYKCALAAGPRLIHDGTIHIDPIPDGFKQMSLKLTAPRSGIGLTRTGKLLLVVDRDYVTLGQFARVMRNLGAVEAMNLDGGPASGLYCDGKTLVDARLRMTNLLLVYKKDK